MRRTSSGPHGWAVGGFGLTNLASLTASSVDVPASALPIAYVVVVGLAFRVVVSSASGSAAVVAVVVDSVVLRDDEDEEEVTGVRIVFLSEEEELESAVVNPPAPEVRIELPSQSLAATRILCDVGEVNSQSRCDGCAEGVGTGGDQDCISILNASASLHLDPSRGKLAYLEGKRVCESLSICRRRQQEASEHRCEGKVLHGELWRSVM